MRVIRLMDNSQSSRSTSAALACVVLLALFTLAGCSAPTAMSSSTSSTAPTAVSTIAQGTVLGGLQPVTGASITLYAAGTAGAGAGASNLLSNAITTDNNGNFNLAGDYICPGAHTQIYVIARGGNANIAPNATNSASVMLAALGNCGDLASSTRIEVNEVTTVAAVWALQQFMTTAGAVGSTATNSAGLANAFAVAKNIADTTTGSAPGPTLPAGAVVETAKLNTLANAVAACTHSNGGSACTALLAAASTATNTPTDTLGAALNIITHPGSNVAAVFNAATTPGTFQPALTTAPNDWTMSLTYGGYATCGGLNLPGAVAIDAGGNALVANYFGGVVSKFSPTGLPAAAKGIAGAGLNQSFGIAIDAADNAWVTNEQSVTAAGNQHHGSISEFSSSGTELSGSGYTGGGIYYPVAVATDANGHVWVADYGSSSATLLASDGSPISGSSGYAISALPFVSAVAIDSTHNAWFAAQNQVARVTPAGASTNFPCCNDPAGIAIDPSGNLWIADYGAFAIVELTASGTVAHTTPSLGGNGRPKGIAVDGAGNVWAANYLGNALLELAGTNASIISPAQGYGLNAPLSEPYGIAIDASGNLWVTNASANTLTQFVGLAAPVKTPLLGPPVQP